MTTEAKRNKLTDQILTAAKNGNLNRVDDLTEELVELGRQAGKNDLLIDLADASEISPDGIRFAIENNGCKDPRR